jgi:dephospho-CoA kinase
MPGAGKDVLVTAAAELGFEHVRMGDVVREFASKAGLPSDDKSVGGFANGERIREGAEIWAVRTMENLPSGNVIIDGSRSLAEIHHFMENLDGVVVVGIDAPEDSRYKRLSSRGRDDDPTSHEEFVGRDRREESWGIRKALVSANIMLVNAGSLEDFRQRCGEALRDLI